MSFHGALLALGKNLGYPPQGGYCHGFSVSWLEPCLLEEEEAVFHHRMRLIHAQYDTLDWQIAKIKEQIKKGLASEEDKTLLEILGFYDRLHLYHTPAENSSFFNGISYSQEDYKHLSRVAGSDSMRTQGGLKKIGAHLSIYTLDETIQYLTALGKVLKAHSETPVGLLISDSYHSIALLYTPRDPNPWRALDITQYDPQYPPIAIESMQEIAEYLERGLKQAGFLTFSTTILVTKKHPSRKALERAAPSIELPILTKEKLDSSAIADYILTAVQIGACSALERLAKEKKESISFDVKNKRGFTPIYIAAGNGHTEVVRLLLNKAGIKINAACNGCTLLYIAAKNGRTEVVRLLLENAADVNRPCHGMPPLYIAVKNGHTKVIKLLLDHVNIRVNDEVYHAFTPLYNAAENGHIKVIKLLLRRGANVNQPCHGFTPLYIAAANGRTNVVELLLKNGAAVFQEYSAFIPLHIAVQNGHTEVVRLLLENGANVFQEYNGVTPLYSAAKYGHTAVVQLLLENGADVFKEYNGVTPLHIAVQNGYIEVVKLLLRKADINNVTSNGFTLLYIAAEYGHTEVVRLLLENGANVNQPCHGFFTPLQIATHNGHIKVVELLLEAQKKMAAKEAEQGPAESQTRLSEHPFSLLSQSKPRNQALYFDDEDEDSQLRSSNQSHVSRSESRVQTLYFDDDGNRIPIDDEGEDSQSRSSNRCHVM